MSRASFRSGKGVQFSGWDGVVVAGEQSPFVPTGVSGWELSTGGDIRRKAEDNYQKRSHKPENLDPHQTTFVFVTPRRWAEKEAWAHERRQDGVWHDVRVYDADDLETWLEQAPAVHVWLSILLGKHPVDALDPETFWEDLQASTRIPIPADLLLAGREREVDQIHKWLRSAPALLSLQAESREEAVAIFAAALQKLPDEERIAAFASTVIVPSGSALRSLTAHESPLTLVIDFDSSHAVASATRQGHRVLVPLSWEATPRSDCIRVSRLSVDGAAKALAEIGIPDERARRLARLARRSFQAFRRKIALGPELREPAWAQSAEGPALLPAMLAGAWQATADGDREAVARLAGGDYEKIRTPAVRWANASDPPVRQIGDIWYVVSRDDAWSLVARYLQQDDLRRLEEVILMVLGNPDPRFDLPEDKRFLAPLLGGVPSYSEVLRRGLAETLAVMATSPETAPIAGGLSPSGVVASIVRKLLQRANADWRLWASLSVWDVLPLLAEAAPDEFLQALEDGLRGDDPLLLRLFATDDGDPLVSSPHTGLLWALETVAWSQDHLGYASRLLAKLARLDPGGKLANRPQDSLRAIFLPWLPQTLASAGQRLRVLDTLRKSEPKVTWELMVKLLPERCGVIFPTATPRWREWQPEANPLASPSERYQMTLELVGRLVQDAAHHGHRWADLIKALPGLPPGMHRSVIQGLAELDPGRLGEEDRSAIWHALRVLLCRHRSFPDADWALPSGTLDRLGALMTRFKPASLLVRLGWLFSGCPKLPEQEREDTRRRVEAVRDVYTQGGLAGLVSLAECVDCPDTVGSCFAQTDEGKRIEDQILSTYLAAEVPAHARLARGFVLGRISEEGREWAETKVKTNGRKWAPRQQAELLAYLKADARTWDLVNALGPDAECNYWERIGPWAVGEADAERAARCFLERGRADAAVTVLAGRRDPSPSLAAEALEAFVKTPPSTEAPDSSSISYDVGKLLDRLQGSPDIERFRLARLELAFLPLLRDQREPQGLHEELARSPEFFAEVLALVFRAEGDEPVHTSHEDSERAIWAFQLLHSWRTIPGDRGDGSVDAQALADWVARARELARSRGRAQNGDLMIGEVLSGSPPGPDGAWPHPAVRDLIEKLSNADVERGIEIGRYSSRGAVTRGPYEGGRQEREIAERYERYAQTVGDRWPRTAAMLRRIATTYLAEAAEEDREAELNQDLDLY